MEDHDHNTAVAVHQMEEEMMEDAADRGLLDMVAAWVLPPACSLFPLLPFVLHVLL